VVVRAAKGAIQEDPTPEALARAEHWRERLATIEGAVLSRRAALDQTVPKTYRLPSLKQ
jgi:hypothetical protein